MQEALMQEAKGGINNQFLITRFSINIQLIIFTNILLTIHCQ